MNKILIQFSLLIIFNYVLVDSIEESFASVTFEDTTNFSQIDFFGKSYGSSWGDYNSDTYPDLWVGNHGHESSGPSLYRNNGDGTFTDIFSQLNFDSMRNRDLHGATWVDFDNDGDQDLLISTGGGGGTGTGIKTHNYFLKNENGTFNDIATSVNLDFPLGSGRIPVWFDSNKDGLLDVLLVNHPRPDKQAPTSVFIQSTSGFDKIFEFKEIISVDSVHVIDLFSKGILNLVFLNPSYQGIFELTQPPFKNKINEYNLKKIRSSDIILVDFNGDFYPDIFRVTGSTANKSFQSDSLEINTGASFIDKSDDFGFTSLTSCRSAVAGDFDNDMDVDIYMACGIWGAKGEDAEYNSNLNLANILYENLGNGTFVQGKNAWGAQGTELGTSETVSTVDYDNDGFLDLFVTNGGGWVDIATGGPHQLFRNQGNNNHWLEIDLVGTKSNRDGIGARLFLEIDGSTQLREQNGGVHFRTQNHQRIHFGLGDNEIIDKIIIYWPSGIVHALENISGNQILQIKEPLQPIPPKHQIDLGVDKSKILCKDGLNLLINSKMSKAACVKINSWDILKERGW